MKAINYFHKEVHHRCLKRFKILLTIVLKKVGEGLPNPFQSVKVLSRFLKVLRKKERF